MSRPIGTQNGYNTKDPAILLQIIEEQKDVIAKLEMKLVRTHDHIIQIKHKHTDINNQIIQANVTFQQSITEANRTIKALRQEKDDLYMNLSEIKAELATVCALNKAIQVLFLPFLFQILLID